MGICYLKDMREEAIIPTEHAPALMKYGHSIREIEAMSTIWMFYDDEFRRLRNGNPRLRR